ncbi:exported hypothetical protein [Paraburkholderia unamae]|uniref:cellulase family glycosylhydrolase n=1 Tax=Paraburkholderia unamae TaxID=219649 RepID=UPI001CB4E53D|nr:cellulase family glycosylhydrolase [Paraburkholderia unamae]CAG9243318.1 exported hypothetical protein [Paraburkholderia unamae]
MKMKPFTLAAKIAMLAPFALAACSGSDSQSPVQSGVFSDSPVKGLYYAASPSGQSGMTDVNGAFKYVTGDTVSFYIGKDATGTLLGSATGGATLTPIDLAETPTGNVTAMLQVLQSLDADHNPDNGIDIESAPPSTCNMTDQSGCTVSAAQAQSNFATSLALSGNTTYIGKPTAWASQMKANCLITRNGDCYQIRGVAYSPSPVGYNVKDGPALGDLFWDSFSTQNNGNIDLYNWYSLWGEGVLQGTASQCGGSNCVARNDLKNLKNMGVNTIRVYAMLDRQLPNGAVTLPLTGHQFSHSAFLQRCADLGIQVLVDIPMPSIMFKQNEYVNADPNLIKFWEQNLQETVSELKDNPVVMGFDIMNEQDGDPYGFNSNQSAGTPTNDFYYEQSIKYASMIKQIAPSKLVGWAIHDDPTQLRWAANNQFSAGALAGRTYLAELAKVFDFWGLNTYQSEILDPVLGKTADTQKSVNMSYAELPGSMQHPVIFTEFGWPGTGRQGDQASGGLYVSTATDQNLAKKITQMYSLAYGSTYQNVFAGAFFFSYAEEWWKGGNQSTAQGDPNNWRTTTSVTVPIPTFPNHWNDEAGYGLYTVTQQGKKNSLSPWCGSGPCLPADTLGGLQYSIDALHQIYDPSFSPPANPNYPL